MIIVLTPCYGHPSKMTFVNRNVSGLAELEPVVLALETGEETLGQRTVAIGANTTFARFLSRGMARLRQTWDCAVMRRPKRWRLYDYHAKRCLRRYLSDAGTELVLVHFESMAVSFLAELKNTNVPVVLICHTSEVYTQGSHRPYARALRRLFECCTKVLCVSEFIREAVLTAGCLPEKADVFYLGVDVPDAGVQESVISDRARIITTGRLVPVKGHHELLRAFACVIKEIPHAELVIVGDGVLRDALESSARDLGIDNSVQFVGAQDNAAVQQYLRDADIYVQASHSEALGLAILEGMAACLPVVATNVGGVSEIVGHDVTGLLVPPHQPRLLAEAIVALAKAPQIRKRMGLAARRVVEDKFSVRKQNARLVQMLKGLISGSRGCHMSGVGSQGE